ncbi:MAG TPA: phage minor head protein [Flavobacteriaceae bacterium]|nr:phage minor head protein [Flavobacteriaceae bacterium]
MLTLSFESKLTKLLKRVETAFKKLHDTGSYKPQDIAETKEYWDLIDETAATLNGAIVDNDMPSDMLQSLKEDVFVFSGLKTHAQLYEASRMLLEDDGTVKSFSKFSNDIKDLKTNYNENYLEAEYNFAISSAQMAGKWADVDSNYDLQYRTANDDKVRESHKPLHNITLPVDDPFWIHYYPPNGWRCRCNAIQVRKGKYDTSDSGAAIKAGKTATTQLAKDGKNKLEIFRFNPGLQKVVFPPHHPYSKVKGADVVKQTIYDNKEDEDYKLLNENDRFQIEKERTIEREIHKIYSKLTIDETNSIYMYSMPDGYYGYLNKYHRTGKISLGAKAEGFDKNTLDAMTRVINRGLDKIPEKYKGIVYRGTYLQPDQLEAYENALNNNTVHIEKAFTSTTTKKEKAFNGNTKYIITSKNGAYIDEIAAIPEDEVLFKAGQGFKVTKIENQDGKNVIYMEEI